MSEHGETILCAAEQQNEVCDGCSECDPFFEEANRPVFHTEYGDLRCRYQEDGRYIRGRVFKYELRCPGCGEWDLIDDEQVAGMVSVEHENCSGGYHETHDFAAALPAQPEETDHAS